MNTCTKYYLFVCENLCVFHFKQMVQVFFVSILYIIYLLLYMSATTVKRNIL